MLGSRRKSKTTKKEKKKRKSEEKAQQLIIKATSTKALLFQSKQVFYLLKQQQQQHEAKRGEKARSKGTTKPSKLGSNRKPVWRIAQRKGESRIEWENIIGKKLKI